MLNEMPEFLVTVSTLRPEYSLSIDRVGGVLPHVTKSPHMDASLAIRWVVRSRTEHSMVYTYHLETIEGEVYNEEES